MMVHRLAKGNTARISKTKIKRWKMQKEVEKNKYREMAELVASKLSDKELRDLVTLIDGDRDDEFFLELTVCDVGRNPDFDPFAEVELEEIKNAHS